MREMIKMVVVLTVLSSFSGGVLAAIRNGTVERIEYQQLKFVKGPAIRSILEGSSNDPIVDRFKLTVEEKEKSFYVGVFEGKAEVVAFESSGGGYGGPIGVMVGVNLTDDQIVGIGVTTHAETPGIGARAQTSPSFAAQFKDLPLTQPITVGDQIDALSGATITSSGVAAAVTDAGKVYAQLKPQIAEALKQFNP
jgi:electron transport complex protein RnfG